MLDVGSEEEDIIDGAVCVVSGCVYTRNVREVCQAQFL